MATIEYRFETDSLDYSHDRVVGDTGARIIFEYVTEWVPTNKNRSHPPTWEMLEERLLANVAPEHLDHPCEFDRREIYEGAGADPLKFVSLAIYERNVA